ncbi:MAG: biosynthetic arginine decarboxylase [Trueperaceae bacterium]|nr:biosynthetic arginine decarboxylase [Trueperaceae bacterium]MCO5173277.1 biosynthetic arginine decarboxylase [Trueperaceae bacterium]MCW5818726.1 biosynthetic arginine decarboxylase [Trueperaceae bacterium]
MSRPTLDPGFSITDADELYSIKAWSSGFFGVSKRGELTVSVKGSPAVPLTKIVDGLLAEGHALPIVLRFPDILEDRMDRINEAFAAAIAEAGYQNRYQGVFPIKVNQRRVVVETIASYGAKYRTGLEAGSKAELALCLAHETHDDALICCNGFKDDDFIRLALWGRKLGRNVIITLEKAGELERVLRISKEVGVEPLLGVRFKLHARGSGQWEASGGDDAKFGLTASELITVAQRVQAEGLGHRLVLLHCHVGSQLTDIRRIRAAVREAAQAYVELAEMGVGVKYLDVGGGLAVDYDGSKTTYYTSANYGLREYADTVVYTIMESCQEWEVAHPVIVTESGRALTAHHSVVIVPVVDAIGPTRTGVDLPPLTGEVHALLRDMQELDKAVTVKTYREVFNEAVSNKETMHSLFDLGYLSLLERAHFEQLYNRLLERVAKVVAGLDYVPEEFELLPQMLADKYVVNFSLFQSLPDHWAIKTLFPIVPLQRLAERPTRNATLVDISCDSDGKIERFIDLRDVRSTLPVHDFVQGQPYYLGVFLTGAYQDVLANAHNLFGRVNEAHVRLGKDGAHVELYVEGQKARRVIHNMGYETPELHAAVQRQAEELRAEGVLDTDEVEEFLELYDRELVGYTYLEAM